MTRAGVGYQTAYYWTCPRCLTAWLLRRRPRRGVELRCVRGPEQRVYKFGQARAACGASWSSTGKREGIAGT